MYAVQFALMASFIQHTKAPDQRHIAYLVCSIICRPKEVVLAEISKQGILPTVAPVKPYTLFALTC